MKKKTKRRITRKLKIRKDTRRKMKMERISKGKEGKQMNELEDERKRRYIRKKEEKRKNNGETKRRKRRRAVECTSLHN